MKSLRGLIEDALCTIIFDHCNCFNFEEDIALSIYANATLNRRGLLRVAERFVFRDIVCFAEINPEALFYTDEAFGQEKPEDFDSLVADAERVIIVLFVSAMQKIGEAGVEESNRSGRDSP